MSNTELISVSDVLALDGLRTNQYAVELLTWGIQSLVSAVLSGDGDLNTLVVQVFPDLEDDVECLRINVTANKVADD